MVLNFSMLFKNGLKAQKLLAQGVWHQSSWARSFCPLPFPSAGDR